jgi:hypothetical protein
MSDLGAILQGPPPTTIDEVIARMRQIDSALPAGDGVGYFNRLYLTTSENILAGEERALFGNLPFVDTLDVVFAQLYFDALAVFVAGGSPPRAWAPLFAARTRGDVAPLQFALAGMNAHINRDLPLALVRTFTRLSLTLERPSPEATDYDEVNAVLADTEQQMKDFYFTPLMKEIDREFDGVEDVVANWSVRAARATAWTNGAALWHLRTHPTLSDEYLEGLDAMVGFAGRGLLVPTAVDEPASAVG